MKVLLDENLDHKLRKNLGAHEVFTVRYMGWSGLENGDLLRTAEQNESSTRSGGGVDFGHVCTNTL